MRRHAIGSIGFILFLAGLFACPGASLAAKRDMVLVSVDQARVAHIPNKTSTLIIGQPGIADVTMLRDSDMAVITGKSFGQTNLIALDSKGNLLGEWTLRVTAEKPDLLLQNGVNRESFICQPQCLPIVDLADAKTIAAQRAAAAAAHTAFSGAK